MDWLLLYLVSLALIEADAASIVIPRSDCECTCECPVPEVACLIPCIPVSKCESMALAESDFSKKCAANLSEEALETLYANCTVAEAAGQDSLDEWISNTLKTCQLRPEDIEITETKCEESPKTNSTSTTYVDGYENCTCSCICNGTLPAPPVCELTTTRCVLNPCDGLEQGDFRQLCEGQLAEEIVDQMKTDCENMNDDMEAIRDLLDNIEAVCAAKGVQTTIEIPDACESTTTISTTTTPTTTSTTSNTLSIIPTTSTTSIRDIECPCFDIVFMVDVSNSMERPKFDQMLNFVVSIFTSFDISEGYAHVGLLGFSDTIHMSVPLGTINRQINFVEKIVELNLESSVTNTHLAIEEMNSMLTSNGREGCCSVGVLLTDEIPTEWQSTINSMVDLYRSHPDVKMIVVGVDDQSTIGVDFRYKLRTIATGTKDENLIVVTDFADLTDDLSNTVISMIKAPNGLQGCTQWVVVNASDNSWSDFYKMAYELTERDPCYGQPVYQGTTDDIWLNKVYLHSIQKVTWAIYHNPDEPMCDKQEVMPYLEDTTSEQPNVDGWKELSPSNMAVVCYN